MRSGSRSATGPNPPAPARRKLTTSCRCSRRLSFEPSSLVCPSRMSSVRPGAGLPAEQPVGRKLVPIAEQRHRGGGAQDLHVLADAAAAAMPARAARIRDQLEAMEQDGIAGLVRLDRQVCRVEHRAQGLRAVLVGTPAISPEDEVVHHPRPAGLVVHAAEDRIGPMGERAHRALRQRLGERAVDRVVDAHLDRRPPAARRRIPSGLKKLPARATVRIGRSTPSLCGTSTLAKVRMLNVA